MNSVEKLSLFGIILSIYIVFVEHKLESEENFEPACDIHSLGVSCSRVFTSEGGRLLSFLKVVQKQSLLDLSNGILGLLFYLWIFLLSTINIYQLKAIRNIMLIVSVVSTIPVSVILFSYMLFELKEICIVCSLCHLLNLLILIIVVRRKDKLD